MASLNLFYFGMVLLLLALTTWRYDLRRFYRHTPLTLAALGVALAIVLGAGGVYAVSMARQYAGAGRAAYAARA